MVFKIKDIAKYLTQWEKDSVMRIGEEIACARADDGKPPFNAVVVEQDWPEFETTWAAIEARMIGRTHPLQRLGARLTELLDEDQWAECEALLLEAGIVPANLPYEDDEGLEWADKDFDAAIDAAISTSKVKP